MNVQVSADGSCLLHDLGIWVMFEGVQAAGSASLAGSQLWTVVTCSNMV